MSFSMMQIMATLSGVAAVYMAAYHYNQKFLEWLKFESIGTRDYITERLGMMFIEIPPERILLFLFGISFVAGGIVFVLFLPLWEMGLFFGIITTIIGWKIPRPIVDMLYQRRVNRIVLQMIDALALMSNGLKSGLSIVQAVGLVVDEMPAPIKQEFNLVLNENKLGIPLEEALNNMSKRVQSDDMEMFVTAINILKETGGNLAETFDTIATTLRERIKVEKRIQSMVLQARMNGFVVLSVVPFILMSQYFSDPGLVTPLFTTNLGWVIMFFLLGLEAAGLFLIIRVSRIEV